VVEGARLESVYRVTPIGGSNPFLSEPIFRPPVFTSLDFPDW
jgi:hypothetical protein